MKSTKILFIVLVALFNSCENETGMDFLQNEWKVQYVTNESKRFKTPSGTLREEAYILKFINDTCFDLATRVNYAHGKYQIVSKGNIIISDYHEGTEVYNLLEHQRNFDEQLVSVFNGTMSYSYSKNKLIFRGEQKKEIVFVLKK